MSTPDDKRVILEELEVGNPVSLGIMKELNGEAIIVKVDQATYEVYVIDLETQEKEEFTRFTEDEASDYIKPEGDPRRFHLHQNSGCAPKDEPCSVNDCSNFITVLCKYARHGYYACVDRF